MQWLKLIVMYLPSVVQGVVAVEAAIGAGWGKAKKQLVLDVINAGAEAAAKIPEQHVASIAKMVDVLVDSLNTSGVFAKSQ
jgi:hypothetical protein